MATRNAKATRGGKKVSKYNHLLEGRNLAWELKHSFFSKIPFMAKSGALLVSESDGRAGNGSTHWRAIYKTSKSGKRLVADLTDTIGGTYGVTLAKRGQLRGEPEIPFKSFGKAVDFLVEKF